MKCNNTFVSFNLSKLLALFFIAGGLFLTGCTNDSKTKSKTSKEKKFAKDDEETTDEETTDEDDMTAVAKKSCDCISDFESSLSAKGRKTVIKSVEEDEVMNYLKENLNDDDKEIFGSQLGKETKVSDCMKKLEKKYPVLKGDDKKLQKKYLAAMEENCSEFGAALMKIGFLNSESGKE